MIAKNWGMGRVVMEMRQKLREREESSLPQAYQDANRTVSRAVEGEGEGMEGGSGAVEGGERRGWRGGNKGWKGEAGRWSGESGAGGGEGG